MKKEEDPIERFLERACEIVRKHHGNRDRAKQDIKSYIGEVVKENDSKFFASIRLIISHAFNSNDLETANTLFEIFYDDLMKYDSHSIPVIAFELEGLKDLWYFQIYRAVQKEGNLNLSTMRKFFKEILFESNLDSPLLIIGETGTSKELMAKAIHRMGNRRGSPFVELNCAAIPEKLLEGELFGYEKGAFTDAPGTKRGLFEVADTGTVFLDETGNMPDGLQYKLLKAIDEKKTRRLGSVKDINIEARFIGAAQPGNIKKILPDLLFRLGYPDCIETPTLRERIGMLGERIIDHSLRVVIKKMNLAKDITLSTLAKNLLLKHDYEGNFRELESILRSGIKVAQAEGRTKIVPRDFKRVLDLTRRFSKGTNLNSSEISTEEVKLKDIIDHAEKIKASIIESKIRDVTKNGRSLKSILFEEGLSEGGYLNFRKKVVNITGKNIREFSG